MKNILVIAVYKLVTFAPTHTSLSHIMMTECRRERGRGKVGGGDGGGKKNLRGRKSLSFLFLSRPRFSSFSSLSLSLSLSSSCKERKKNIPPFLTSLLHADCGGRQPRRGGFFFGRTVWTNLDLVSGRRGGESKLVQLSPVYLLSPKIDTLT